MSQGKTRKKTGPDESPEAEVQTGRAAPLRHLVPKVVTNGSGIFHLLNFQKYDIQKSTLYIYWLQYYFNCMPIESD